MDNRNYSVGSEVTVRFWPGLNPYHFTSRRGAEPITDDVIGKVAEVKRRIIVVSLKYQKDNLTLTFRRNTGKLLSYYTEQYDRVIDSSDRYAELMPLKGVGQ